MSYEYAEQREWLFSDEGQRAFLAMRDWIDKLLEAGGAFRMQEAMKAPGSPADTWRMHACVDRLVEAGGDLRGHRRPGDRLAASDLLIAWAQAPMIRWLLGILAGAGLIVLADAAAAEQGWWRFALGLAIAIATLIYLRHELAAAADR